MSKQYETVDSMTIDLTRDRGVLGLTNNIDKINADAGFIRCVECNEFVNYEDAYIIAHEPDEDGHETIEICECRWCYKEKRGL